MITNTSPWAAGVTMTSPDGAVTARIDDAGEIAMGAPTSGDLHLSNGMSFERCNPSITWSDDSRYLAVPQWTPDRKQRLLVVSVERRTAGFLGGTFRVLELHSFEGGVVRGIDSPIYQPCAIELGIEEIEW